jgi:MFS family permease
MSRGMALFVGLSFAMDCVIALARGALPWLVQGHGYGAREVGVVMGVGSLAYFLTTPLAGHWSERTDRRRFAVVGALLAATAWPAAPYCRTLPEMAAVSALAGVGSGLFWPPLLAWLPDAAGPNLRRVLAVFNLAWSAGATLGAGLYGPIYLWSPLLLYSSVAALLLLVAIGVLLLPKAGGRTHEGAATVPTAPHVEVTAPLAACWAANFIGWLAEAMLSDLFPTLAASMGRDPVLASTLLAISLGARMTAFVLVARLTHVGWRIPLGAALLAAAGAGLVGLSSTYTLFALGFAMVGVSTALGYHASISASLQAPRRGTATGLHETVLGVARFSAPTGGGYLSSWTRDALGAASLRVPYAAVATASLLLAAAMVPSAARRRRACPRGAE